jgi:nitroimidazol reductase NimA-like FMN-containing flavoprotein (pyridoxamine 5'-phosphate oxidase superfamily)
MSEERQLTELTRAECLSLLGTISLGRLMFTLEALPAIRPVSHIVDDGNVIIRSHLGAAVAGVAQQADGAVVGYEADTIDPQTHVGWSVVITGVARLVTDPAQVAGYQRELRQWRTGESDYVISVSPELVSGFRLDLPTAPAADAN